MLPVLASGLCALGGEIYGIRIRHQSVDNAAVRSDSIQNVYGGMLATCNHGLLPECLDLSSIGATLWIRDSTNAAGISK